jgi:small redox-active disulfide protein 2
MLEIKVFGSGCASCMKLETLVREVVAEHNLQADIVKVTDRRMFVDYGVMFTPGLWVNGRLLSSGKIPTKNTLEHWLKAAAGEPVA